MPDVKEQLLKIVSYTDPMDAMDELLENLRCDHCKHWNGEGYFQVYGHRTRGFCQHPNHCGISGNPEPDFFCAAWEAKGA